MVRTTGKDFSESLSNLIVYDKTIQKNDADGNQALITTSRKAPAKFTNGKGSKKCYNCGRKGHFSRDCWKRKGKDGKKMEKKDGEKEEKTKKGIELLVKENALASKVRRASDKWMIDSVCAPVTFSILDNALQH